MGSLARLFTKVGRITRGVHGSCGSVFARTLNLDSKQADFHFYPISSRNT